MESTEQINSNQPKKLALVFMPDGGWMDDYYRQLIQPTLQEAGYACQRGKALFSNCDPKVEILDPIKEADLLIAWLSGRDPNVLFALGIFHVIGGQLLLITESNRLEEVPLGFRAFSILEYQKNDPVWGKSLQAKIRLWLTKVFNNGVKC